MPRSSPLRLSGVEAMRALAHPTRIRMLELLRQEPLSASELSRRLGIRFGSARFHLQQLVTGRAWPPPQAIGGCAVDSSCSSRLPRRSGSTSIPTEPGRSAAMHQAFVGELGRRLRGAASDSGPGDSAVDIVSLREVRLTPDDRDEAQRIAEDALRRIRALDAAPGKATRSRSRSACSCSERPGGAIAVARPDQGDE